MKRIGSTFARAFFSCAMALVAMPHLLLAQGCESALTGEGLRWPSPIETDRFVISAFKQGDSAALATLLTDSRVRETSGDRYTHEEGMKIAESAIAHYARGDSWRLRRMKLSSRGMDGVLGLIQFYRYEKDFNGIPPEIIGAAVPASGWVEIGFALAPFEKPGMPLWGRGAMTEIASRFIEVGFSQWGIERIYAQTRVSNPASAKVLKKLGFTEIGRSFQSAAGSSERPAAQEEFIYFALTKKT